MTSSFSSFITGSSHNHESNINVDAEMTKAAFDAATVGVVEETKEAGEKEDRSSEESKHPKELNARSC